MEANPNYNKEKLYKAIAGNSEYYKNRYRQLRDRIPAAIYNDKKRLENISYLERNPEKKCEWQKRRAARQKLLRAGARATRRDLPVGVLNNSAPSRARDLLLELTKLAPKLSDDARLEAIAEAALLVLETAISPAEAMKQATRTVRKQESFLRYAKPLEDCFWL